MSEETILSVDEIKEIFREVLDDFEKELIDELKAELSVSPEHSAVVSTSEVCRRWGKSRTTLSKLMKAKKLVPVGKYGHSLTFRTSDILRLFGGPVC